MFPFAVWHSLMFQVHFNKIIGTLHIPGVDFIYGHPMMTIIIANVWHGTAFSMLNFQSALDNVSGDIEEAAV